MNLTTTYLGLTLKHPIVASASPLSHTLDGIKKLEDAGAAAVVMYSLDIMRNSSFAVVAGANLPW